MSEPRLAAKAFGVMRWGSKQIYRKKRESDEIRQWGLGREGGQEDRGDRAILRNVGDTKWFARNGSREEVELF